VQKRKMVLDLQKMKADNQKIVMTTAYDFSMAQLVDRAGVDAVLVGDSLGMVIQGQPDTISVTIEDMIYHAKCVDRGLKRAHLVVDMPFMSYQVSVELALQNAGRLMKEGRADSVKLEGGEKIAPQIEALVSAGIPVVGHLGLTPQSVNTLGGYRLQGRSIQARERLKKDALILEEAGASMLVLEMVPTSLASEVSELLSIPTIGIGAGVYCDGQVLVCNDLLGMNLSFTPRFLKRFANLEESVIEAFQAYIIEVRDGAFPSPEHSFGGKNLKEVARLY
jgi:3-methyl-2-oxobutanoate hydroxymethyltransferase